MVAGDGNLCNGPIERKRGHKGYRTVPLPVRGLAVTFEPPHLRAMPRRALLIINARSRSGESQAEAAIERLKAYGIEPVHRECSRREDLSPLIVDHAKDVDCAVVGGGDGTLN